MWYVYLAECNDGTFYCGVTTDVERRISEHNGSKKGARYTRSRRPVRLVGFKEVANRSEALVVESKVKKMNRTRKAEFFI